VSLVEGKLMGEQKKYIRTIQKSAENLLDLVGILDLSKIEAGRLDIEIMRCSVKKLAELLDDKIQFISEPGVRSLFSLIIPA
jgi:signal transduction histidine kinase